MKQKTHKIRLKIRKLAKERKEIEAELLRNIHMVSASFCVRPNGMYYLSTSINGESRHRYVKQEEKGYWQKRCSEWRRFSEGIARWVKLIKELEQLLRKLGRSRLEPLPERKAKAGEAI